MMIIRVGGKTGYAYLSLDPISVSLKYNYLIKFNEELSDAKKIQIRDDITNSPKPFINDTAGVRSMSKRELIPILNEILNNINNIL